jgi:hypothetical protein
MAGFVDDAMLAVEEDDDGDVDGSAAMVGIVGKFCTRFTSNSTNTASGCTCRTSVPANDADTSDICAVPNKYTVQLSVLPPSIDHTDIVESHRTAEFALTIAEGVSDVVTVVGVAVVLEMVEDAYASEEFRRITVSMVMAAADMVIA